MHHHTMITRLGLQRLLPIVLVHFFCTCIQVFCCISFQLRVVCAWLMIKCSVHLHDAVICMPCDLDIKMNWILSFRVQFPMARFCLVMEKLLAKRSQVKPCICYIVGKCLINFHYGSMALVCLSTSIYPFRAFKTERGIGQELTMYW